MRRSFLCRHTEGDMFSFKYLSIMNKMFRTKKRRKVHLISSSQTKPKRNGRDKIAFEIKGENVIWEKENFNFIFAALDRKKSINKNDLLGFLNTLLPLNRKIIKNLPVFFKTLINKSKLLLLRVVRWFPANTRTNKIDEDIFLFQNFT